MDRAADARNCVFCRRRPMAPEWRPFCSERCKLQDLARWVDGGYRIPDDPVESPDETPPDPNRDRD